MTELTTGRASRSGFVRSAVALVALRVVALRVVAPGVVAPGVVALCVVALAACSPAPAPLVSSGARTTSPAPGVGPKPAADPGGGPGIGTAGPAVGAALADLEGVEPVVFDPPAFGREPAAVVGSGGLSVVADEPNEITDEEAWFRDNRLVAPIVAAEAAPADVPRSYRGQPLIRVQTTPELQFLLYGADLPSTSLLVAVTPDTRRVRYAYDFSRWSLAPELIEADRQFVYQAVTWARQVGEVLYVAHAHSTYARSSAGMNGYLSAIDVGTSAVLWRSAPLVANARSFAVVDGRIVTGYGFTAEPDHLFVLDPATGAVTGRLDLASGPEYIVEQDGSLLVRCYDRNYVLALRS